MAIKTMFVKLTPNGNSSQDRRWSHYFKMGSGIRQTGSLGGPPSLSSISGIFLPDHGEVLLPVHSDFLLLQGKPVFILKEVKL